MIWIPSNFFKWSQIKYFTQLNLHITRSINAWCNFITWLSTDNSGANNLDFPDGFGGRVKGPIEQMHSNVQYFRPFSVVYAQYFVPVTVQTASFLWNQQSTALQFIFWSYQMRRSPCDQGFCSEYEQKSWSDGLFHAWPFLKICLTHMIPKVLWIITFLSLFAVCVFCTKFPPWHQWDHFAYCCTEYSLETKDDDGLHWWWLQQPFER